MNYAEWHEVASKAVKACEDDFINALFEGSEIDNVNFAELNRILELEVFDTTKEQRMRALFFIIMACSFRIENKQDELVESLINK